MLHQLVFQSLLGEIDYGAQGDFTPAGYVLSHNVVLVEFLGSVPTSTDKNP